MINPTTTFAIATAPDRRSRHWKQGEVTWGEMIAWLDEPADQKEAGNYVLGRLTPTTVDHPKKSGCTDLHRRKGAIASRSVLTLDVDSPAGDLDEFPETVEMMLPYAAIVHTTFSSTPTEPRFRVLIPLDREVAPDEYWAIAHAVMQTLGAEQFDPGSVQAERYMFLPSEQQPGYFRSWVFDGDAASVTDLLKDFDPEATANAPKPKVNASKRNPFEIEGPVGAFNRVYADFNLLIAEYDLPYDEEGEGRWRLHGARSEAGLVFVTDGLVFSHHVHDPAYNVTCSAFDLVRLHRFYELDEEVSAQTPVNRRPSHKAMLDVAMADPRVTAELLGVDFMDDLDDIEADVNSDSWKMRLNLSSRTGNMTDVIGNWDLLVANYEPFTHLRFNEFTLAVESSRDLPWRSLETGGAAFSKIDLAALCLQIERDFGIKPSRTYVDELVQTTALKTFYNPVRDYLDGLKWDGTPRLEECLPGVRPTPFSRIAARKSLVAAVARVYEPGVKWDHSLILFGSEGLGKTFFINRMAQGYANTLGRIDQKDTLIAMQRSWIMVSDEGHSLRKADHDAQKEFLTRTEDTFRMPYDREAQTHKRHCVIWGTTNDEVFLRRQEGNRRFLIVRCEERADFGKYTDEYVDQVWAEAVHLYREGERLFLTLEESSEAAAEREGFTEEDAMAGVIENYLDTKVPGNWFEMSEFSRQQWLQDRADGLVPEGDLVQQRTCSIQLWVEAFGKRKGDHRRTDLLEITKALKSLPGWRQVPGRHRLPLYGPQVVFERTDNNGAEGWDLL